MPQPGSHLERYSRHFPIVEIDTSAESLDRIDRQVQAAAASGAEVWGIFDNTAAGHALGNALAVDAVVD